MYVLALLIQESSSIKNHQRTINIYIYRATQYKARQEDLNYDKNVITNCIISMMHNKHENVAYCTLISTRVMLIMSKIILILSL